MSDKDEGRIDQIKNSTLNTRPNKDKPSNWDHFSFALLLIATLTQIIFNWTISMLRNNETNATDSSLCKDNADTYICNVYPHDMKVLYNDLATGVPLAPSGNLFAPMWGVLYGAMFFHAIFHWMSRRKNEMYNWAVHSLLIVYQLTLLFWPMVFASRHLWLAFGLTAFAACIIRSVSVSASKGDYIVSRDRWWHWVCSDLLNVQTTWLILATFVAFSLALKDNISTIKLGDDWAAGWIGVYTVFAAGLAVYTATTLGIVAAVMSLVAILVRSRGTFEGPDTSIFDIGTYRLTDGSCIVGIIVLALAIPIVFWTRMHGDRKGNFGGRYGSVRQTERLREREIDTDMGIE